MMAIPGTPPVLHSEAFATNSAKASQPEALGPRLSELIHNGVITANEGRALASEIVLPVKACGARVLDAILRASLVAAPPLSPGASPQIRCERHGCKFVDGVFVDHVAACELAEELVQVGGYRSNPRPAPKLPPLEQPKTTSRLWLTAALVITVAIGVIEAWR